MKYLKLSSVLVASLFFVIGCGNKSVQSDGGTTTEVVEQDVPQETEVVANNDKNGSGYPEGGFMGNGVDGNDEYGQNGTGEDGYAGYDNGNGAGNGMDNETDNYGTETALNNSDNGDLAVDSLTTIYFDFDKYNIRQDMKEYIRANADYIKAQNMQSIVLQGNTDEFGGDEYNTALGLKRALSVRDALVLHGLPKSMFSTISYGMHKPVCTEKTNECYAKNRRTDLVEKQ